MCEWLYSALIAAAIPGLPSLCDYSTEHLVLCDSAPDDDGGVNVCQPGRAVEFHFPPRFPAFLLGCAERVLFE